MARPHRPGDLVEGGRRVVRDAEPVDLAGVPRLLEKCSVLLPGDKVVDLLDLDATEPAQLRAELQLSLGERAGPDLLGDDGLVATLAERLRERFLGGAVHRRGDL